jgi:transcriptional regulator with XRE-family HTH domain
MDVRGLGTYIREQRRKSSLTLRKLSGAAGVSIPYLSQVERGLRKPSADILQGIARGLQISAETLFVQAGMLEHRPATDVIAAVMADQGINERQKQALIAIYEAFRDEAGREQAPAEPPEPPRQASSPAAKRTTAKSATTSPRKRTKTATTT